MLVEAGQQDIYHQGQLYSHHTEGPPQSVPSELTERPNDIMTYSHYKNGSIFTIPKIWSPQNTDDLLVAVYSFVKTYIGASGAGQGSIDHRIEQAMDLVKSHLMSAVRSEVEELRDKISKLEDTVNHLSRENEVLRANVNPEVLASLLGNRSILGGIPPDQAVHPAHPALPPPNQH